MYRKTGPPSVIRSPTISASSTLPIFGFSRRRGIFILCPSRGLSPLSEENQLMDGTSTRPSQGLSRIDEGTPTNLGAFEWFDQFTIVIAIFVLALVCPTSLKGQSHLTYCENFESSWSDTERWTWTTLCRTGEANLFD